jgi:Mn2+/Fe2+ NRAMP family transporter
VKSGADAAEALRPLLGDLASTLFGVGLIAAGLLAVPVLAGAASYAIAETFGWKSGFDHGWRGAPRFYAVYLVSTSLGVLLNFSGIDPIDALFLTSLIMGLIAPPLLALTLVLARDRRVMKNERIGRLGTAAALAAVIVMTLAAVALVWTVVTPA